MLGSAPFSFPLSLPATTLAQIAIFLIAAIVALTLSHKPGLGAVLGYLGADMVIGPRGLKLIDNVDSLLHALRVWRHFAALHHRTGMTTLAAMGVATAGVRTG